MEDFSAKTNCFVRFALLSVMRENIISGEVSPALWIEWSLYKCPLTFFLDFSLWNTLFVFQMSNIINKQRRYGFFSLFSPFFRVSQYLSKQRDREFLCLILWGSVHVYVREMRRRDWNGEEGGGFSVGSIGMDAPGSFRGWCHWWRSRSILPATVCLWGRDSETGQGDTYGRNVAQTRTKSTLMLLQLKFKDVDHSGVAWTPRVGLKMHQIGHLMLTLKNYCKNAICCIRWHFYIFWLLLA